MVCNFPFEIELCRRRQQKERQLSCEGGDLRQRVSVVNSVAIMMNLCSSGSNEGIYIVRVPLGRRAR